VTTWLGLDPSIAAYGYAVLCDGQLMELGTFHTRRDPTAKKLDDRAERVEVLGRNLLDLIDRWGANEAFVESLAFVPGRTSGPATSVLGRVRGLTEGICLARGVRLREFRPDVVKAAVTGRRNASKAEVAEAMARLYLSAGEPGVDENATDALAVAHVGASRNNFSGRLQPATYSFDPDDLSF
jgi:Holliday junction resolvasome RuvABC endonuclease subunit